MGLVLSEDGSGDLDLVAGVVARERERVLGFLTRWSVRGTMGGTVSVVLGPAVGAGAGTDSDVDEVTCASVALGVAIPIPTDPLSPSPPTTDTATSAPKSCSRLSPPAAVSLITVPSKLHSIPRSVHGRQEWTRNRLFPRWQRRGMRQRTEVEAVERQVEQAYTPELGSALPGGKLSGLVRVGWSEKGEGKMGGEDVPVHLALAVVVPLHAVLGHEALRLDAVFEGLRGVAVWRVCHFGEE